MSNPKIDVVWEPIPNSSQELALCAPADIVFLTVLEVQAKPLLSV